MIGRRLRPGLISLAVAVASIGAAICLPTAAADATDDIQILEVSGDELPAVTATVSVPAAFG
jgi:hypothetical protein